MATSNNMMQNQLLSALPELELNRISPHLELVKLTLGEVLYESGHSLSYIYFPTSSIISIIYDLADGSTTGIAVIGKEGILGISLFMGGDTTIGRALVQTAGYAYRMKGEFLLQEFNRAETMMSLLLRYTQAFIIQITQTAVCNRHHSIGQQLCRWLLFSMDRQPSNTLTMTHGLIANMMGVRREGVTEAAGKLQHHGLITYKRGVITIIDRPKLEQQACECYAVVKKEYDRLIPATLPTYNSRISEKYAILNL